MSQLSLYERNQSLSHFRAHAVSKLRFLFLYAALSRNRSVIKFAKEYSKEGGMENFEEKKNLKGGS